MQLYCGIDLHSNNSVVSVINEHDPVIKEKRLDNDLDVIQDYLSPFKSDLTGVVVESTYNWYWLVDGLMDKGYCVHLANTLAIQQYNGIKHTNDETDARFLAHLLRLDILPVGFIYPKADRHIRDVLRRRLLMVKQSVAQRLSLQSLISRHTGKRLTSHQVKRLQHDDLGRYLLDSSALFQAQQSQQLWMQLQQQIKSIEDFVLDRCQKDTYTVLTSTPGIGKILGMTILMETGPVERFAAVGNYSSYARCVPTSKISNGKLKGRGNSKNGNRYLSMAFVEAAHYATIWNATIKRYYQKKCKKVPVMVAKKAVANKLTRACYHMLKEGQMFDIQRAFG